MEKSRNIIVIKNSIKKPLSEIKKGVHQAICTKGFDTKFNSIYFWIILFLFFEGENYFAHIISLY